MRPVRLLAFLILCTALTGKLEAQIPAPDRPGVQRLPDTLARHDTMTTSVTPKPDTLARLHFLAGAHWTTSTGPAAHLALVLGDAPGRHGEYGGPVLSVEPGLYGGKFGVGLGGVSPFGSGLLRASYLRSWGDDGPLEPDQGYLGVDARMAIRFLALGIGWHGRISGEASGDGSIFTFSAGVGF
jgi:hypothetical protein